MLKPGKHFSILEKTKKKFICAVFIFLPLAGNSTYTINAKKVIEMQGPYTVLLTDRDTKYVFIIF